MPSFSLLMILLLLEVGLLGQCSIANEINDETSSQTSSSGDRSPRRTLVSPNCLNAHETREALEKIKSLISALSGQVTQLAREQDNNHADCVEMMTQRQPDPVNAAPEKERLVEAARECRYVLASLLASRVDPNARSRDNKTAIQLAAENGHENCVRLLRCYGAYPVSGPAMERALIQAVQVGRQNVVDALLAAGVSGNIRDRENKTAIFLAAGNGYTEIVKSLLNHGGVRLKGEERIKFLGAAALAKNVNKVRALLAAGADFNAYDEGGEQPLHDAAQSGCVECIEALLKAGADVDAKDKSGETALHEAAWYGRKDTIDYLLKAGIGINIQDKNGESALHEASYKRHADCVKTLVLAGIDVNIKDKNGATALDIASRYNCVACVDLIKKRVS